MRVFGRNQVMGPSAPGLVFFAQVDGFTVDLTALSFQVFDTTNETTQLVPVQVFPAMAGNKQAVNLSTERLSEGRYAPAWTVPNAATAGRYEVKWFWRFAGDTADRVASQSFEVIAVSANLNIAPYYCLVADLRDEGITSSVLTDARAVLKIQQASKLIEAITGRFFEARYSALKLNGRGNMALLLGDPVVAIEALAFETSPLFPATLPIERDCFRVYNRHLRGLLNPDDRNSPKVELFSASEDLAGVRPFSFSRLIYPRGEQNVSLTGVFGFTDADGTPFGETPSMIRRACQLLVLRDSAKLIDCDKREDLRNRWRLTSERTRDQQYNLDSLKGIGLATSFVGDPEIDQILALFMRPPAIGSA